MKKDNKQKILTIIIIVAIIVLIVLIGFVIYDEKIKIKQNENTIQSNVEENKNTITQPQEENTPVEKELEQELEKEEYVGQEENNSMQETNTEKTKDEKAIELAKKTWGEEDNTVTFSIEEKKENIYYIAVKSNATAIAWYEVNTETWQINEF